jgi:hypothetical protein
VADGADGPRRAGAAGPVGRTALADGDDGDDGAATDSAARFVTDGNALGADDAVGTGGFPFPGWGGAADEHGDRGPSNGAAVYCRTGSPVGTDSCDVGACDVGAACIVCSCAAESDADRRSAAAASDECAPDDRERPAIHDDRVSASHQHPIQQHHTVATTSHQHASRTHQHSFQLSASQPVSRPWRRRIRTR